MDGVSVMGMAIAAFGLGIAFHIGVNMVLEFIERTRR